MFDLKTPTIAAAIVLAATLNHAGADMIDLAGQGASSNVPLNAQLDVHVVDPYSVILTLTNNAYDGGADNRITYFGFQMPTAGVSINIDSESDGSWSAKQYAKLLSHEGVKLKLTRDAVAAIADKALELKTGARALRSIMENLMLDIMYELPQEKNVEEVVISAGVVRGEKKPQLRRVSPDMREDDAA